MRRNCQLFPPYRSLASEQENSLGLTFSRNHILMSIQFIHMKDSGLDCHDSSSRTFALFMETTDSIIEIELSRYFQKIYRFLFFQSRNRNKRESMHCTNCLRMTEICRTIQGIAMLSSVTSTKCIHFEQKHK
jgi:hypothetical protein